MDHHSNRVVGFDRAPVNQNTTPADSHLSTRVKLRRSLVCPFVAQMMNTVRPI
jgi:hypothetical protein